jgi:anti-anti-sigma factor
MPSASLTVPAQLDSLSVIGEFVNSATRQAKMSEREAWQVQLAVDEAATNIIQHAYNGQATGNIRIEWSINEGELRITLMDKGQPFDPSNVPEPDITSPFEGRQAGGLGIYLMHKMMDEVEYVFDASGNTLTMRKRFAEPAVADLQRFNLNGRLDARGTVSSMTPINAAVDAGARMILIDLTHVSFLSSSGLRALLLVRREMNERQGVLMLCGLQPQVEEVFAMTGFSQVFEIYRTTSDALQALSSRSEH